MNEQRKKIRMITGMAILVALTVILQFIAGYIRIGKVEINLALIPIIFAAFLYGPFGGLTIGLVNGLLVILNPGTADFLAINPIGTVLVCLLKTGAAGFVSGIIYNIFKKKREFVGSIIASVVVPVINTFIFFIGCLLFFIPLFGSNVQESLLVIATTIFAVNTLIEIIAISILSPAIYRVLLIVKKIMFKEQNNG